MKLALALLILFVCLTSISLAQNAPKATIVDEMGNVNCEDLSARVSAFYQTQLKPNPGFVGYIVIYPKQGDLSRFDVESLIRGQLKMWQIDAGVLNIVRGKEMPAQEIHFWITPPGSTKPDFEVEKWVYAIKRPRRYYRTSNYPDICPADDQAMYLSILRENPDLRGNILIWERSAKKYQKERIRFQTEFHEIPRLRVRFFRGRCSNGRCDGFELWLVPNK
jgi:hypothetical protein